MIVLNFILKIKSCSSSITRINSNILELIRFAYHVKHSPRKRIFYVTLDRNSTQATLYYRLDNRIMDLRSLNVPKVYKGRGIARLLTETAFTYAIEKEYFLYLTCDYTQKYFLANSNYNLKQRIIGPKKLLSGSLMDKESFYKLDDPEENPKS